MRGFADAMIELLDELDVEPAVVVGLSMGGSSRWSSSSVSRADRRAGWRRRSPSRSPKASVSNGTQRRHWAEACGSVALAREVIADLFGPRWARPRACAAHLHDDAGRGAGRRRGRAARARRACRTSRRRCAP